MSSPTKEEIIAYQEARKKFIKERTNIVSYDVFREMNFTDEVEIDFCLDQMNEKLNWLLKKRRECHI